MRALVVVILGLVFLAQLVVSNPTGQLTCVHRQTQEVQELDYWDWAYRGWKLQAYPRRSRWACEGRP